MVRVAVDQLGSTEPSSSPAPRRFSPVRDENSRRVPVLYTGADLACALGETVFHDLGDDPSSPAEVFRADLLALRAGTIAVTVDCQVADLTDAGLNEIRVSARRGDRHNRGGLPDHPALGAARMGYDRLRRAGLEQPPQSRTTFVHVLRQPAPRRRSGTGADPPAAPRRCGSTHASLRRRRPGGGHGGGRRAQCHHHRLTPTTTWGGRTDRRSAPPAQPASGDSDPALT